MARITTRLAVVVAGAALALAGCGQGTDSGTGGSDPAGRSSGGDKATPAAALKLTKAPFCDKLDTQAMADALHAKEPLKLTAKHRPGQKYSIGRGFPKQTSTAWSCEFDTPFHGSDKPQVYHYASISGTPYTKASFADYVKQRNDPKYRTKGSVCEVEDKAGLVDTANSLACHKKLVNTKTTFSPGFAQVTYRAFVDGSLVVCGAGSSTESDFEMVKAAGKKLCTDFFETVTD